MKRGLRTTQADGYGGVGIYIKRNIKFSILSIPSTAEVIVIATLNLPTNVNIITAYFPPNLTIKFFKEELEKIFTFANSLLTWGSSTSPKGASLENIATVNNFRCLNDKTNTFTIDESRQSALDVTFTNIEHNKIRWSCLKSKTTSITQSPITQFL